MNMQERFERARIKMQKSIAGLQLSDEARRERKPISLPKFKFMETCNSED